MILRAISLMLFCAAGMSALISLSAILMPASLKVTVKNSRNILWSFQAANNEIVDYRATTGRLPDSMTSKWRYRREQRSYRVHLIDPSLNDYSKCCREAVDKLGMPPVDSYLLEVWRGEWAEYYAPWSGHNTLIFDPDDYATSGSLKGDIAL